MRRWTAWTLVTTLAIGLVAGCASDVTRTLLTDSAQRAKVVDLFATNPNLAGEALDKIMANDSLETAIVDRVMANGNLRELTMSQIAQNQDMMDALLKMAVQDPAMKDHLAAVMKGTQMVAHK